MTQPSVFVSSTYIDLKHVREHVGAFIDAVGYQPLLFEKGGIGFDFQKPIDESCYEAVSQCDMFVLIIGGRYGAPTSSEVNRRIRKYNSITKKEYLQARSKQIPIFIFVDGDVHAEYRTFSKNRGNAAIRYAFVDNPLIFELIDDIYKQKTNNYMHTFSKMEDITTVLKAQWAAILKSHLKNRSRVTARNMVRINSLKLFYYRSVKGMSLTQLSKETGIGRRQISGLERLERNRTREFDGYHEKYFPEIEYSLLSRIERVLDCNGKLRSGQSDDFLALWAEYYSKKKSGRPAKIVPQHPLLRFGTRAVVFDFDGTLTKASNGMTTWELIWDHLGYSVNECAMYHTKFRKNEITHREWCEITLARFQERNFHLNMIPTVAEKISVLPGLTEVIDQLDLKGIKYYILSGSIRQIINASLGDSISSRFEEIKANEFRFTPSDILEDIVGTNYDFAGKADFLKRIVQDTRCSPMDILFVGNAGNDRWASNSGARTLCVNPQSTDPDNPREWTYNIRKMEDLRDILNYV